MTKWVGLPPDTKPDKIKQVTTPKGRYYEHDGKRYPSVTTINAYAHEAVVPMINTPAVVSNRDLRVWAGSLTHEHLESMAHKRPLRQAVGPGVLNKLASHHAHYMWDVVSKNVSAIYASEIPMISKVLGIAGTCDLVCSWNDQLCIVDYKTVATHKTNYQIEQYFLQAASYAQMWHELTGVRPTALRVIMSMCTVDWPQNPNAELIVKDIDPIFYAPEITHKKRLFSDKHIIDHIVPVCQECQEW